MIHKRTFYFIVAAVSILLFQVFYYQLTLLLFQKAVEFFPGLSNDCYLMIHHFFQFLMLFIPAILLHFRTEMDFGYHIKDWKKGWKWSLAGIGAAILFSVIASGGIGFRIPAMDTFVFQMFFSGLGEEIMFRSLPIVILMKIWGGKPVVKLGTKFPMDVTVILSALFFALGHISFQFGYSGFSYNLMQMLSAFFAGIILGEIYQRTNSIWTCMLVHGIYNVTSIVV